MDDQHDQMDSAIPGFWERLRDAHEASEDVDNFDLRSEDPASVAEYEVLVKARRDMVANLIQYVQGHANDLMLRLRG
jgi:hypothetical protein